jgi:hypothetical protein
LLTNRFLVAGFLSCLAVLLFVVVGFQTGHSADFNYAWSVQYADTLTWSDPLPRYLPGLWAGLGGHDFFFYAPLPFWFIAAVVDPLCFGCAPSTEIILGSAIILIASGFAMFAFLRAFFDPRSAVFGAVIYGLLPYHLLIDWFERQAAGEFTAYVFLPLVALGMERVRRGESGGIILALSVAGLALSHLPTTLLVAHAFAILVLLFVALERGGLPIRLVLLGRFIWFAVLGLALASFYWLPAVMLLDSVSPASLFHDFFEPWRWLYGHEVQQPHVIFARRILVSFVACLPMLVGSTRHAKGSVVAWIWVPAAFAVFMNTAVSDWIWRAWIIDTVQFPWRLMVLVDFATAVAASVMAARISDRQGRQAFLICLTAILSSLVFLAATVPETLRRATTEEPYPDQFGALEYFSPEMTEAVRKRLGQPEIDHFDQSAVLDTLVTIAGEFKGTVGEAAVLDRRARSLTVVPPAGTAVLSLPVQYWFLWTAETATGTNLETRANPATGTLDIVAPASGFPEGPVTVSLPLHESEIAGGAASLLALLALLASSFRRRQRPTRRPAIIDSPAD